jgi:hypothetical protein
MCFWPRGLNTRKTVILHFNYFYFLVAWNLKSNGRKIEWKVGKKILSLDLTFFIPFFSYLFNMVFFIITYVGGNYLIEQNYWH